MSNNLKYIPEIDGLRAIAVLSVLIFHIDATYLSGGFVGVDIFFVISGFLITGIIKNEIETIGNFSFKNFYIRRAKRLLPALFIVFIVTTIVAVFLLSPTHLSSYGGSLVSAILSLSNMFFWIEADYFDVSAKVKPLLHTWSLSIEEQFYFIWPLTLLFLLRLKNKKYIFITFAVFVGLSLYMNNRFDDGSISFINNHLPSIKEYFIDGKSTIFFLLPFRIYEFILGAVVVWLMGYQISKQCIYDIIFVIGLCLVGYSIFFFDESLLFPSYYALVPVIGTSLLIYSSYYSRLKILLSNKLFVGIGLISYSLYLVHWPIIVFWNYLSQNISLVEKIAIFVISFVLAYLSYKYIEQPFRKKEFNIFKPKVLRISFLILFLLGFIGIHSYVTNGWAWRVNTPVVFENVGDSKDFHKKFYGGEGYPYTGAVNTTKPSDIVVIGDSHGRHYLEGIYKEIALPYNLNLYSSSGTSCIMLPNFTRITEGKDWDKLCSDALKKGLEFLKQSDNNILLLSASWVSQMQSADILDERGNSQHKTITKEDIGKGILELKEIIGSKTLIVIGQVPGVEKNLYDIFTRPNPVFFKIDYSEYLTTHARTDFVEFNQYFKKLSNSTNKFIFLDPFDVLCQNSICKNTDDKKRLIYSDTNHLSKYGSIEVINRFKKLILNELDK
ncbi:acyltransferase family protein [Aliarcobacter butzleri]